MRALERFVSEFQSLKERFVFIVDDKHRRRPRQGAGALRAAARQRQVVGQPGPDHRGDDDELLRKMAASGCKALFIGFESLNRPTCARWAKISSRPRRTLRA